MPVKTLKDGSQSKVTVVPFYDRTQLIRETVGTLESALTHEILICIIVVLILVINLRASTVIAAMLPMAVLATFIIMKVSRDIEANIRGPVGHRHRHRCDGRRRGWCSWRNVVAPYRDE